MPVDSYGSLDPITRRILKAWVKRDRSVERDIPWTPLEKPLAECRVALLSSAAIALATDEPFDQQGERDNPWWGDPSHRIIPTGTRASECAVYHLHINARAPGEDLNVCLPMDRAVELAEAGTIGSVAPSHYSIMGYLLRPEQLLAETVPKIVARLRDEAVDVLVMVPV